MQMISRFRSNFFRLLLVSFGAVYLLFSVGVIKATHFCMGREASVTFFSADSKKCYCGIFAAEKDGCCEDERDVIKIEDDQKNITTYTIRIPQLYILDDLYTEQLITSLIQENLPDDNRNEDDNPADIPLFKTNCSFVFYDSEQSA
jgi:hypothetical protein